MNALVETQDHGDVREVRLARPPVNALDTELCRALIHALDAAQNEGVGGIVLSGNAKVFSAGLDVPHLLAHGDDRRALLDSWQAFFGVARTLAECRVPVAVAMAGHAPAGGCVLALCCDYRVMARSADPARPFMIGLNETRVGLVAPEGIQRLLRRVVGPHRAERMLVSGQMVSSEQALELGLVDELALPEDVTARAALWIESLLALPRRPMLQTRSIARTDLSIALSAEHIDLERYVEAWYEPDTQAGLTALVARLRK